MAAATKDSGRSGVIPERKRAYRYEVLKASGAGVRAVGDSPYIIDWTDFGPEYTWNIVGGPKDSFQSVGFIHGRFVDKGYLTDDGKYEPETAPPLGKGDE
jgi:hypothetical protein